MPLVRLLLQNKANVNEPGIANETPLFAAVRRSDYPMAVFLVHHGANTNHRSKWGYPALDLAAFDGEVGIARLLLKNGADPNCRGTGEALSSAVARDQLAVVKLLLARGANPNLRSQSGRTALEQARYSEDPNPRIEKLLLAAGARGRPRAVMQAERKRLSAYFAKVAAQRRTLTGAAPVPLSPEDKTILNLVFSDLATYKGNELVDFSSGTSKSHLPNRQNRKRNRVHDRQLLRLPNTGSAKE